MSILEIPCDFPKQPCGKCLICKASIKKERLKRKRVRLKESNKIRKRAHRKRAFIFNLYGHDCYICGSLAETIDHVIPLSRGGTNEIENLRPACYECNVRKGSMSLTEFVTPEI